MLAGRIDTYVEYTGTALTAILHDPIESDPSAVFERVQKEYKQRFDFDVLPSLGFNNTFAIVIRGEDARRLHLKTISDAVPYAAVARRLRIRIHGAPGRLSGPRARLRPAIRRAAEDIWIWACCIARCSTSKSILSPETRRMD